MIDEYKNYVGYVVAFAVLVFAYWMALTSESIQRKTVRMIVSRLSEQVLYLYSFTAILFFLSDEGLKSLILYPITHFEKTDFVFFPLWLVAMGWLIIGLGLPLYHAFVDRKKSQKEKQILIIFAILAQGTVGIESGIYALSSSNVFFDLLLSTWNIITGLMLILLLRLNAISEKLIDDNNTKLAPVLWGSVIVLVIFYMTHFVYQLYWATGMSICFIYIQSVNDRLVVAAAHILLKIKPADSEKKSSLYGKRKD